MSEFIVKSMTKKELRNAYDLTVDQWDTWMKKLRKACGNEAIGRTRAMLTPKEVRTIVEHFGTP
jgi:hypothetical protein